MPQETLQKADKQPLLALPTQGQSLPEGKETVCVLEEEMLILVLILKGPDRSMALSSL